MKKTVTGWYLKGKPKRKGVYETGMIQSSKSFSSDHVITGGVYQHWNGKFWGISCGTIDTAYLFKNKTLSVGKLADLLSLIFPIKSATIKPMINPLFNTSSTSNSLIDTEINKNAVLSAIQKLELSKNEGDPSKN